MNIRPFVETDEESVIALWRACDLTKHTQRLLLERGCPKVNLLVRSTNTGVIGFYRSLGYAVDEAVAMGKRLIPDEPR